MTEKQLDQFKKEVYEPYTEAWRLMKEMRDTEPKDEKYWDKFIKKQKEFYEKYPTEIGHRISTVILDALDIIGKIERS